MSTATLTRPATPPDPAVPGPAGRPLLPSAIRHGLMLARRGVVKTINSTEALLDVTLQPIVFTLLFVYVFAARGARADGRVRLRGHRRRPRR